MPIEGASSRRSCLPGRRHFAIGAMGIVARSVALAMLLTLMFRTIADAAAKSAASPRPSVFQRTLQSDYQNIFEATIIAGAQAPDGESMRLDGLLALASRDGLQRLDDSSIFNLIYLRSELAERTNVATCAGIWSGQVGDRLVPAIESLPADQQRRWARLFDQAALATIKGLPVRPPPTPEQYQTALNSMLARLPRRNRDAVDSALKDDGQLTAAQECNAVRAFYSGLRRTSGADALIIARALLHQ